jgi:hypothetical protein
MSKPSPPFAAKLHSSDFANPLESKRRNRSMQATISLDNGLLLLETLEVMTEADTEQRLARVFAIRNLQPPCWDGSEEKPNAGTEDLAFLKHASSSSSSDGIFVRISQHKKATASIKSLRRTEKNSRSRFQEECRYSWLADSSRRSQSDDDRCCAAALVIGHAGCQ